MSSSTDESDKSKKRILERTPDEATLKTNSILTGFYGPDGKRIKHQVCTGALELPSAALNLYEKDTTSNNTDRDKPKYKLPHLEAAVRPSLDETKETIITFVQRIEQTQDYFDPLDGTVKQKTNVTMRATNKLAPQRLRGGGGEDEDVEMKDASASPSTSTPGTAATATAPITLPNQVAPAAPANNPIPAKPTPVKPTPAVATTPAATLTTQPAPVAVPTQPATASAAAPPQAASKPEAQATATISSQPPQAQASSQPIQPKTQLTVSTTTVPTPTTSITTSSTPTSQSPPPQVLPLKKRPAEQYESHAPTTEDAKGIAELQSFPEWYHSTTVSDLERALLPEWFDQSAAHRTEASYIAAREKLLEMTKKLGHTRFISFTMARRSIPGDAGSLLRLHTFFTSYGLINADAMNESTPTPVLFTKKKARHDYSPAFVTAMAEQARKGPPIDWKVVASQCDMTAEECERLFLNVPMEQQEESFPPLAASINNKEQQQESTSALVEAVDPKALKAVIEAALSSTKDVSQAQTAAQVGVVAQQAAATAQTENESLSTLLNHVVELRLKKLENRLRALDDVEGMLDAERMALNLERRDLYTARCRHWFGGA